MWQGKIERLCEGLKQMKGEVVFVRINDIVLILHVRFIPLRLTKARRGTVVDDIGLVVTRRNRMLPITDGNPAQQHTCKQEASPH